MAVDYFAFQANPDYYRIEDAVIDLYVDTWDVHLSNPKPGDRAIIWKSYGRNQTPRRRGIVGFAEILSTPSRRASDNQYWIDSGGTEPRSRVDIKLVRPPNLPLWEHDYPILSDLSVSGSQGVVFNVTPDQFAAAIELAGGWPDEDDATTEAEAIIDDLSGRQLGNRQGYTSCPTCRRAVETRAMEMATAFYEGDGYSVTDVSRYQSYDLECTKSGTEVHVEVKGTTGNGERILLTRNEVIHAMEFPGAALLVVNKIERTHSVGGTCQASSGEISELLHPWTIDQGALEPMAYSYNLSGDIQK